MKLRLYPFSNIKAIPAAAFTALVFSSVTVCLCWLSLQVSRESTQLQLQESLLQHHSSIQNEIENELLRLESFVNLYHISPTFDRYAFHTFAKFENSPWLVSRIFSKKVSFQDFNQFENTIKGDASIDPHGYPNFQIADKSPDQDALVALYLEPVNLIPTLHGANLSKWYPTILQNMEKNSQVFSFLIKDQNKLSGNHIYLSLPVYKTNSPTQTEMQRHLAFTGAFTSVISAERLFSNVFNAPKLHLSKLTLSGTGLNNEVFNLNLQSEATQQIQESMFSPVFKYQVPLSVAGKKWMISYEIQTPFGSGEARLISLIAAIGLLLTVSSSAFIFMTIHTRKIAKRLARDMNRALSKSEEFLLETQKQAKMCSFQLNTRREITAQSGNIPSLFGLTSDIQKVKFADILKHIDTPDRVLLTDSIQQAFNSAQHKRLIVEIKAVNSSWLDLIIDPASSCSTSVNHDKDCSLRIIAMDVTEKFLSRQKINYLAHQDALTGLANRTSLRQATEEALIKSRKENKYLAILFLDLDRFKFINDSQGHHIGDQVLTEIGNRLRSAVKSRDFIARLGGDEFVILVEELASEMDLVLIAKRLLALVCAPLQIGEHSHYLTTSIGIAIADKDFPDADLLMKQADIAMYHSKEKGKNKFTIFSSEIADALEIKTNLEKKLRIALDEARFLPYYQPQYCTKTGRLRGVESLLRWEHPERGVISAVEFIATAEESGMIIQIGNQILHDVIKTAADWKMPDDFVVALNVSSLQFFQAGFVDFIIKNIRESGIKPHHFEIEVTETMIMQDTEVARSCLEQLHGFGLGISIDDFGTGYASLTYLRDFPVQRIKMDQRFVKGHTKNHKDMSIVKAITRLGHDFGVQVIAEGVETQEQLDSLIQLDCEFFQGWLRSGALPAQAIAQLLLDGKADIPKSIE